MKKDLPKKARKYVLSLLKYNGRRPLSLICKDSCSEVSRLLAMWFHKELANADIYIAKGKIKNLFHDLLIIKTQYEVFIVDPTVWQFFKNKRSIFIGKADSINRALKTLAGIYGGEWKISEQVTNYSKTQIQKLKSIVAEQIK